MDDIPEGSAAGLTYHIVYGEDLWLAMPEDRREHCKEQWIEKAAPTTAEYIVLMLVPDPVFPQGEHSDRYVAWQTKLEKEPAKLWNAETYVFFEVSTGYWSKLDYSGKLNALETFKKEANKRCADRYRVNCGTEILAQGRL